MRDGDELGRSIPAKKTMPESAGHPKMLAINIEMLESVGCK